MKNKILTPYIYNAFMQHDKHRVKMFKMLFPDGMDLNSIESIEDDLFDFEIIINEINNNFKNIKFDKNEHIIFFNNKEYIYDNNILYKVIISDTIENYYNKYGNIYKIINLKNGKVCNVDHFYDIEHNLIESVYDNNIIEKLYNVNSDIIDELDIMFWDVFVDEILSKYSENEITICDDKTVLKYKYINGILTSHTVGYSLCNYVYFKKNKTFNFFKKVKNSQYIIYENLQNELNYKSWEKKPKIKDIDINYLRIVFK